jgi:hypothetical protein
LLTFESNTILFVQGCIHNLLEFLLSLNSVQAACIGENLEKGAVYQRGKLDIESHGRIFWNDESLDLRIGSNFPGFQIKVAIATEALSFTVDAGRQMFLCRGLCNPKSESFPTLESATSQPSSSQSTLLSTFRHALQNNLQGRLQQT